MRKFFQWQWTRRTAALALALLVLSSAALAEEVIPMKQAETAPEQETSRSVEADWNLLVVSAAQPLPREFTVELTALKNGMQVDARICEDLDDMLADCREAGLHPVICSAYRTRETQARLFSNKIQRLRRGGYSQADAPAEAARWVAPPDTSEHQTGLALDIVSAGYQVLDSRQEQTPEQQWLMEHCREYGFILRYPADKSAVTGIGYEPWHYRYVGREAASAMGEGGLCLEEYTAALAASDTAVPVQTPTPAEESEERSALAEQ